MTNFGIAELARRSGFPATTVRYYEQLGLLDQVRRTASGYRVFDDAVLDRLAFIDRARRLGIPLDDIGDLVRLWANGQCGHVQRRLQDVLDRRRQDVADRMSGLIALEAMLAEAAARLAGAPATADCGPGCGCDVGVVPAGDVPIACSLGAAELDRRRSDWRALSAAAVSVQPTGTGVVARFAADPDTVEQVIALVAAEARCCPFFTLTVRLEVDGLHLSVTAPPGAEPLARGLLLAQEPT